MIETYIKKVASSTAQGDAREESYYGSFSNFLESFAEETGKKHIQITTLPQKTEAGNPDFRVWDGRQQIVGYIEAKKWLKDREDRTLSNADIEHFQKMIVALTEIVKIMREIDKIPIC
ncbi:MAG: hypothetical protein ABSC53_09490 [Bacteroidota bacterium]